MHVRDVEESYIFTSQILHSDDYSQYFYIKGTGKTEKLKKNLRHTVHRNIQKWAVQRIFSKRFIRLLLNGP